MLPTTESTKSIKQKTPTLNLSTKFSNPATEDEVATIVATGDDQTQDPTTATTATTPLLQAPAAALRATGAHTPAQTLQTDNETRKSLVSTAKSKDITKTTATRESGTTSHASPEAENHTGQDQR